VLSSKAVISFGLIAGSRTVETTQQRDQSARPLRRCWTFPNSEARHGRLGVQDLASRTDPRGAAPAPPRKTFDVRLPRAYRVKTKDSYQKGGAVWP
jgi:hypothetical protein